MHLHKGDEVTPPGGMSRGETVPGAIPPAGTSPGGAAQVLPVYQAATIGVTLDETMAEERQLSRFLQRIAEHVCRIGGYDFASVLLSDAEEKALRILGVANLSADYVRRINGEHALPLGRTTLGFTPSARAYLARQPVAIPDVLADPDFGPWKADAWREGYRALLCVPLMIDETAAGVLDVYQRQPHTFTAAEVSFLTAVAGLAAMAVQAKQTSDRLQASLGALQEATELHRRMLGALSLREVGETLSDFLGSGVVLTDSAGNCLWSGGEGCAEAPDVTRNLGAHWLQRMRQASPGEVVLFAAQTAAPAADSSPASGKATGKRVAAIALYSAGVTRGYIVAGLSADVAEGALLLDLQEASLVAVRVLVEERRRLDMVRQSQEELAADIFRGHLHVREHILARASVAGFDLRGPQVALIIQWGRREESAGDGREDRARLGEAAGRKPHVRTIEEVARRLSPSPAAPLLIVRVDPESAALLYPVDEASRGDGKGANGAAVNPARMVWAALHDLFPEEVPLRVAAGAIVPVEQAASSYQQAESAIKVLRAFAVSDGYLWYPQAGVLGVLAASAAGHEIAAYGDALLQPVRSYDERNGADLLMTLRSFLRSGLNAHAAAAAQFVHPNTVYYRLHKIEELTGLSLGKEADRLQLEVAMLIHDLGTDYEGS